MPERAARKRNRTKRGARKSAKAAADAEAERGPAQSGEPNPQRVFHEFLKACGGGGSSNLADTIGQLLVAAVGSVPSVAVAGSMLAANAAEGAMYFNAVAHQQKTNLLGMAMTAKCVRHMLDGRPDSVDPDFDDFVDEVLTDTAEEP